MRRLVLWLGLVILLVGATLGTGAPLDPTTPTLTFKIDPYTAHNFTRQFDGGRKAVAAALGEGTGGFLVLYVYDAHGNCVGWDDTVNHSTRDDLAVSWLPARSSTHTIEVKSLGRLENEVRLVVRQDRGRPNGK
ncbi:MAG: hypothetical protein L0Z62_22015 [Gemmataceae bacterium]|nr:hypothetical protein [Gemmataceae bacterium]